MVDQYTYMMDMVEVCVDLIGKQGPIKVDTYIAKHNDIDDLAETEKEFELLLSQDVLTIGTKGQIITKEDITKFTAEVKTHMSREVFNNGRSYFFGRGFRAPSDFASRSKVLRWG